MNGLFSWSGLPFPSSSYVMCLPGVCGIPRGAYHLVSFSGTPDGGFLSSSTGTLASRFLASFARTPVGTFLLASPGLWYLSEFLCHPVATATFPTRSVS